MNSSFHKVTINKRARWLSRLGVNTLAAAALTTFAPNVVHAQSPQVGTLPTMVSEGGTSSASLGLSNGLSFLIYSPSAENVAPSLAPKAATNYGVTEDCNLLSPGSSTADGLSLIGAALFAGPNAAGSRQTQNQAIKQTVGYNRGALNITFGYVNVGKMFSLDSSQSNLASLSAVQSLVSQKGQTGFNTAFAYNQGGNKLGFSMASVADSLQSQHRLSETMSLERDFDKALSLSFQHTENGTEQFTGGDSHLSSNLLHLAYSPTRTGFLLDIKSSDSLSDQGSQTNDLVVKVAKQFSALNLSSQFESSMNDCSGTNGGFESQRFDASGTLPAKITFSSYWAQTSVLNGTGDNDFDVIMKTAESRYLALSAEYEKMAMTNGTSTGKQSLTAGITPGSFGPLGPLLLALSINDQQTPYLDCFDTYTASLSGEITPHGGFDFGMSGAKFYLAYTDSSAGGSYAANGHSVSHSERTLRLVSAPSGKNALSWTISQQQRLDQNGQPLRTASDYSAKYLLNHKLSLGANTTFETAQNGNFSDLDSQGLSLNWNEKQSASMIAQYVHSSSASQNIADDNGYFITYSGPALNSQKVDLGLGLQRKYDFNGLPADGATANINYGWKSDESNVFNVISKVTNWQNHGFNNEYDDSVEASGQINFQRVF